MYQADQNELEPNDEHGHKRGFWFSTQGAAQNGASLQRIRSPLDRSGWAADLKKWMVLADETLSKQKTQSLLEIVVIIRIITRAI